MLSFISRFLALANKGSDRTIISEREEVFRETVGRISCSRRSEGDVNNHRASAVVSSHTRWLFTSDGRKKCWDVDGTTCGGRCGCGMGCQHASGSVGGRVHEKRCGSNDAWRGGGDRDAALRSLGYRRFQAPLKLLPARSLMILHSIIRLGL